MRYAVALPKGGVGKTTLAVHLARHFAAQGPTLLLDGDADQEKSAWWAHWRNEADREPSPTTLALRGKALYQEGRRLVGNYATTVIDTGGHDGPGLRSALGLADRVLVPMSLSRFDTQELILLLNVAEEMSLLNPTMSLKAVIYDIRTGADTTDVRAFLAEQGVSACQTTISHREVYWQTCSQGLTVEEIKPRNAEAIKEMSELYKEIEQWDVTSQ